MRLLLLGIWLTSGLVMAQEPGRFQFKPGETWTSTIAQTTTVSETTIEERQPVIAATVVKLDLTRRWKIQRVEPNGEAVIEMSFVKMKQVIKRPGPKNKEGQRTVDELVLDSETAEGAAQIPGFRDNPAFVLRVDARGQVLEAKDGKGQPAPRMAMTPPFRIVWPEAPKAGTPWVRNFTVALDPPLGTGEKFAVNQTFTPTTTVGVYDVKTDLPEPPRDATLMQPLIPYLWEGQVTFDATKSRLTAAKLRIRRELPNHAGPGTQFLYETQYQETTE
ncbi:MAG: hypothetical protein ACRC8S_09525 [Fimbriiglobus sp.]